MTSFKRFWTGSVAWLKKVDAAVHFTEADFLFERQNLQEAEILSLKARLHQIEQSSMSK